MIFVYIMKQFMKVAVNSTSAFGVALMQSWAPSGTIIAHLILLNCRISEDRTVIFWTFYT